MDEKQIDHDEAAKAEAEARAEVCSEEIRAVLDKHRCQIAAAPTYEPVGSGPTTKLLIGTAIGILALPPESGE